MSNAYDVIIVGGGVAGCAIAFNLAELGVKRVLLLEKDAICSGDTAKSCAIVRTHYSNPLTCKMAMIGRDILADFTARVGGDSGFKRCGYLIFSGPGMLASFESNIALQRQAGAEVDLIDARQALEIHPKLNPGRIAGAAFEPSSGYADPHLTTMAYAEAARRLGAEIRQGVAVHRLVGDAGGAVSGVETGQGVISAPHVVVAAGVWTNVLSATVGVRYPYETTNHKVVHFSFDEDYSPDRYPVNCTACDRVETGDSGTYQFGWLKVQSE